MLCFHLVSILCHSDFPSHPSHCWIIPESQKTHPLLKLSPLVFRWGWAGLLEQDEMPSLTERKKWKREEGKKIKLSAQYTTIFSPSFILFFTGLRSLYASALLALCNASSRAPKLAAHRSQPAFSAPLIPTQPHAVTSWYCFHGTKQQTF